MQPARYIPEYWDKKNIIKRILELFIKYRTFKVWMIGWSGLISKTLLLLINSRLEVSPTVCAFISLQEVHIILRFECENQSSESERMKSLPLHVSRPTKLPRSKYTRWCAQTIWDLNTGDFVAKVFLYPLTGLTKLLLYLLFLLFILITYKIYNKMSRTLEIDVLQ